MGIFGLDMLLVCFLRILISWISMICGALWSVDKRSWMHGRGAYVACVPSDET